jgi:hypothetical protein
MLTKFLALIFLEFLPLYCLKLTAVARLGPVTLMCLLCGENCSVFLSNELKNFIRHMGFEFFCLPEDTTYNEIEPPSSQESLDRTWKGGGHHNQLILIFSSEN